MTNKSINHIRMERVSTQFLRLALFIITAGVLALSIFALPSMWQGGSEEFPVASKAIFLIMLGLYATTIPFYVAVWQSFKLLHYIDQNKAFSESSVQALRVIKYCASIIAVLYVGGVPLLLPIVEADDAPGLLVIGMVIACFPVVIAVFTAILEKLLQNVLDIKSENDLTV